MRTKANIMDQNIREYLRKKREEAKENNSPLSPDETRSQILSPKSTVRTLSKEYDTFINSAKLESSRDKLDRIYDVVKGLEEKFKSVIIGEDDVHIAQGARKKHANHHHRLSLISIDKDIPTLVVNNPDFPPTGTLIELDDIVEFCANTREVYIYNESKSKDEISDDKIFNDIYIEEDKNVISENENIYVEEHEDE